MICIGRISASAFLFPASALSQSGQPTPRPPSLEQCPGGAAMLSEELSTDMDRITQLQDAILDLLTITHTSIEYITKRTQFEQTSAAIPQTLQTPLAASRVDYKIAIETFVADIVKRSKDIELLIAALPKKGDAHLRAKRLEQLQSEMMLANQEYNDALAQSEALLKELQDALAVVLATEPGSNEDVGDGKQGHHGRVAGQVSDIEEMGDA